MRKKSTFSRQYVRVKLVGVLRGIAGKGEFSVQLTKPITVSAFIQSLIAQMGPTFKESLVDPELDDPRPNALILINDTEISALQGLKTKISGGETVVLIPISHGG